MATTQPSRLDCSASPVGGVRAVFGGHPQEVRDSQNLASEGIPGSLRLGLEQVGQELALADSLQGGQAGR